MRLEGFFGRPNFENYIQIVSKPKKNHRKCVKRHLTLPLRGLARGLNVGGVGGGAGGVQLQAPALELTPAMGSWQQRAVKGILGRKSGHLLGPRQKKWEPKESKKSKGRRERVDSLRNRTAPSGLSFSLRFAGPTNPTALLSDRSAEPDFHHSHLPHQLIAHHLPIRIDFCATSIGIVRLLFLFVRRRVQSENGPPSTRVPTTTFWPVETLDMVEKARLRRGTRVPSPNLFCTKKGMQGNTLPLGPLQRVWRPMERSLRV